MIKLILFFLLLCYCQISAQSNNLYLLPKSSRAKCLDGSQPGFYFTPGKGEGKDKFYIYLEGGGRCSGKTALQMVESCFQRSKTDLGSSLNWKSYFSNTSNLSELASQNPLFYNWNKVYVQYCDGNLYQGSSKPIAYKNTSIYFRGYDIMTETIQTLIQKFGMDKSSVTVLSGGSAGGLGAYFWNQYLRKTLPISVKVFAAPDSGLFPAVDIPQTNEYAKYIDLITDNNRQLLQPQGCLYLNNDLEIYKCQVTYYVIDLMPVPVFIINSLYDLYSLTQILQVDCISDSNSLVNCTNAEMQKVDWLKTQMYNTLIDIKNQKPNWGCWAISCIVHVYSNKKDTFNNPHYNVPQQSGLTAALALKQFIENQLNQIQGNQFNIDQVNYPNNIPCNGY